MPKLRFSIYWLLLALLQPFLLLRAAEPVPSSSKPGGNFLPFGNLPVAKDPCTSAIWQAVLNAGDPAASRPELLKQFQAVVANYPACEHRSNAAQITIVLQKMISEDEAHAKTHAPDLGKLPLDARVRELIFHLRDQNGWQMGQPGFCNIFNSPLNGSTNTPAHQLVSIGLQAVPQLIEALNDRTLTRSIGFHRAFYFSHTILTVGDCAAAVLQRIAGKTFYRPRTTSSYLSKDGNIQATRAAVETWWAEIQQKGEKQTLVDATAGGDSIEQARLLMQRFPEAAPDALMKGIPTAALADTRVQLIELLGQSNSPKVSGFLELDMRVDALLEARAACASALKRRRESQQTTAMIGEWKQVKGGHRFIQGGDMAVVNFLASCDSPDAIAALGHDLQRFSVDERRYVVKTVGESSHNDSPPTADAVESLLVNALFDEAEIVGPHGIEYGFRINNWRISDVAGHFLSKRWPNRYRFNLGASLLDRDQQRIGCQNVWRTAHGLALRRGLEAGTSKLPPDEAARIVAIDWASPSVEPQPDFKARLLAMQGTSLSKTNFIGVLTSYASAPAPGSAGIEIKARKDEDLTGVRLFIRLVPGVSSEKEQSWKNVQQDGFVGNKSVLGTGGEMWKERSKRLTGWDSLASALDTALSAPPDIPFFIRVRMFAKAEDAPSP